MGEYRAGEANSHTAGVGDLVPVPSLSSTGEGSHRITTPWLQLDSIWTTTSHGTLAVVTV